jgi:precorrin-8X/cobalt-precorrin-8 methylmutase
MKARFDAYLCLDYSAANAPKLGKDSIWIAEARWEGEILRRDAPINLATRELANEHLRTRVMLACEKGQRLLLGVDFALGYPKGFAEILGFSGPVWASVRDYLHERVTDDQHNRSNRFEVAGEINRTLQQGGQREGPFWGLPRGRNIQGLQPTKPTFPFTTSGRELAEYRDCEAVLRRANFAIQSVWKLYGQGSVGSQSLLGIARLGQLQRDREMGEYVRVWPFEPWIEAVCVVAEVWPSLATRDEKEQEKDAAQVSGTAEWMAQGDLYGELDLEHDKDATIEGKILARKGKEKNV